MTDSQITLEENKIEFERNIREVEELKANLSIEKDIYEQMAAQVQELGEALSNSQRARNERQSRMNEAQLKLEQARMKEQYLVDQIRERYMLILSDVVEKYQNRYGDPADAESQLKE